MNAHGASLIQYIVLEIERLSSVFIEVKIYEYKIPKHFQKDIEEQGHSLAR